jgi:hypothetical protein
MGQTELLTLERDHFSDLLFTFDGPLIEQIATITELYTKVRSKIKHSFYII